MHPCFRAALAVILAASLFGCYRTTRPAHCEQIEMIAGRAVDANDIALPAPYRIEAVATGLSFPTGITFDGEGRPYVVEAGYSYGELWTTPRLIRIEQDGGKTVIVEGKNGPWTGAVFHDGDFFIAEGGELEGGRILRVSAKDNGKVTVIVEGLPSRGDHHTNGPVIGPDGFIYFSQGTATNSGVAGKDNYDRGWLKRYPEFHDTPCADVTLTGHNYRTEDFTKLEPAPKASTGAFSAFGTYSHRGQVVEGNVPCNGSVMRISQDVGDAADPELVAWGFRNPFGMAFSPDGRLFVTDNMYDDRGSRPVYGAGDLLWEVKTGTWYGWPDFHGGHRLDEHSYFKPPGKDKPQPLLADYPNKPPRPAAIFAVHSSPYGFDFSSSSEFGYAGEAFVAQFGDEAHVLGKVPSPAGFKVVRVNVNTGLAEDFAANKGEKNGPASFLKTGGLERPVAARFSPGGKALYIVDFGVLTYNKEGVKPRTGTGVVWKITRKGAPISPDK